MKGILFTEELQKAVIERRKTMTRRTMRPQPSGSAKAMLWDGVKVYQTKEGKPIRPRYRVGETIYIKEPFANNIIPGRVFYKYEQNDIRELEALGFGEELDNPGFWRNKQSMPLQYARHFLRITAVYEQWLQAITEVEAHREGIRSDTPLAAFKALMDAIYGPELWKSNPLVWVYGFEYIDELTMVEKQHYNLVKR